MGPKGIHRARQQTVHVFRDYSHFCLGCRRSYGAREIIPCTISDMEELMVSRSVSSSRSSFASSRPWLSRSLAYAPARDPRSCRGSRAALVFERHHSCDQIRVGQALPGRAVHKAVEAQQGTPRHIAFVEPESELVNVAAQMLRADVVEGAVDASLQDRPYAFDAVDRDVIAAEFSSAVIDDLVLHNQGSQADVPTMLVGMQGRSASTLA